MIVVEEKINTILSQIPAVLDNTPKYAWGDELHLDKLLGAWKQNGVNPYPLIYQTSKEEIHNDRLNECETKWRAVIATQNDNTDLTNDERWKLSFKNELNPMIRRIVEGFKKSGIIDWEGRFKIARYGNYGDSNEHFTEDIWDAISFEADIKVNDECVKTIRWTNL